MFFQERRFFAKTRAKVTQRKLLGRTCSAKIYVGRRADFAGRLRSKKERTVEVSNSKKARHFALLFFANPHPVSRKLHKQGAEPRQSLTPLCAECPPCVGQIGVLCCLGRAFVCNVVGICRASVVFGMVVPSNPHPVVCFSVVFACV